MALVASGFNPLGFGLVCSASAKPVLGFVTDSAREWSEPSALPMPSAPIPIILSDDSEDEGVRFCSVWPLAAELVNCPLGLSEPSASWPTVDVSPETCGLACSVKTY